MTLSNFIGTLMKSLNLTGVLEDSDITNNSIVDV